MAQQQFLVPQFIDVEDKIVGPVTVRQFVLSLIAVLLMFIEFRLAVFWLFLIEAIFTAIIFGVLAFLKINGMPFHFFLLNLVQTRKRPNIRVWDKALSNADLKAFIVVEKEKVQQEPVVQKRVSGSRLSQLSLVVNTGGVYKGQYDNLVAEETVKNQETTQPN